jgi:hypothetical protein
METRWFRRLGPGIAALGAMAAVASTTAGAPPVTWEPPTCPGRPAVGAEPIGAWFRLDPILTDGTYVGQWLALGAADPSGTRRLQLDAESFATGPTNGGVLVGTDDGKASEVSLIDVGPACLWSIATSADVIRNAILDPGGGAILESRVDRRTRADLGIWRRSFDGAQPVRLLPPIGADDRFGPTWWTDLAWSEDGATLVVGSCGETACRYRLLDGADTAMTIANPSLGALVGVADGRLVTRRACRGLPCPIASTAISSGEVVALDDAAGLAVMARDDRGRSVVVHEVGADGRTLQSIRPAGDDRRSLPDPPTGLRLLPDTAWAGSAAEHPDGSIAFGPDGRVSPDAVRGTLLRPITADAAAALGEVTR